MDNKKPVYKAKSVSGHRWSLIEAIPDAKSDIDATNKAKAMLIEMKFNGTLPKSSSLHSVLKNGMVLIEK